jgi:hypothetical protein
MDLMSGLAAASHAIQIAKDLRSIDRSVDEATFKLKLSDLTMALADTQIALSDAKLQIAELNAKLLAATSGDICPVCRIGRLGVTKVTPHDYSTGIEFHSVSCDGTSCSYSATRTYDATRGVYSSKSE